MEDRIDWLEGIRINKERGEITVSGQRHNIVNSYAFRAYRDAISEIIGHGADAVLYLAGKRHTERFIKKLLTKSRLASFIKKFNWGKNKIVEHVVRVLDDYGYGRSIIQKIDIKHDTVIVLENSCIATNYKKKQDGPVCSYIAGLIAGGGEVIAGKPFICIETHCLAKGDKYCRFVAYPEKK